MLPTSSRQGAVAGIIAGFSVWTYTLLIPALLRAGIIEHGGPLEALFSSTFLNPTALFGLEGLDRWSHSLFWGLLLNTLLLVGVSLFTRQSDEETRRDRHSQPPDEVAKERLTECRARRGCSLSRSCNRRR